MIAIAKKRKMKVNGSLKIIGEFEMLSRMMSTLIASVSIDLISKEIFLILLYQKVCRNSSGPQKSSMS